jgi:hypothetical protein
LSANGFELVKPPPSCQRRIVVESGTAQSASIQTGLYRDPARVWFNESMSVLPNHLFHRSKTLDFVSFESNSRLTRIGSHAFSFSPLHSILIPRNCQILCSDCFFWCKSLQSVTFESNSRLTRIESKAFLDSSLQSIVIPCNFQILCSECFSGCESLESVSFESNSRLTRIEFRAFSYSSLQSIMIPRDVRFIDGSAFCDTELSISIESGHGRFVIRDDLLITN